ncbi:NAD(P)H-binding protein [Streptomyces sp. NPDC102383]|uniref:NAD(P)H-binding protein n=1 Tax=Streptomyces sp. NPDC102383 TaxID=3366165 RepID=UPI003815308E
MILVTGATGTIGSQVARRLAAKHPLRLMTRHPERLGDACADAEIIQADYSDPPSLRPALRGVRAVFLVTSNPLADDDGPFVHAARAAGVRHLVKLSAAAVADEQANDLITSWQRRNEQIVRSSGLHWTLLRPRSFMSNALSWAHSIRSKGVVRALHGASLNACVDPRDVADVAVRALCDEEPSGLAHLLTGPAALSPITQTDALSQILGRPLTFEELDVAQARRQLRRQQPHAVAEALLHSAQRQHAGAKREVTHTVEKLLGRPAGSFQSWVSDHAYRFADRDDAIAQSQH